MDKGEIVQIGKGNKSPNRKGKEVQIEKGYKSPNRIWKVNERK